MQPLKFLISNGYRPAHSVESALEGVRMQAFAPPDTGVDEHRAAIATTINRRQRQTEDKRYLFLPAVSDSRIADGVVLPPKGVPLRTSARRS